MLELQPSDFGTPLPLEDEIDNFSIVLGPRDFAAARKRIILLHGLMQDHGCWLPTAQALVTIYPGVEVLLVDFVGHGLTACPRGDTSYCQAAVIVRQLQRVLFQRGWVDELGGICGPKLVFAGLSLGGAVAMRWAQGGKRLGSVERFVQVASAGLEVGELKLKVFRAFFYVGAGLASFLVSPVTPGIPPLSRSVQHLPGHLHCMLDAAPMYGMDQDMPERARQVGVPISCVASHCDELCPPRLDFWLGPQGPQSPEQVVIMKRFWIHSVICTQLHHLRLHEYPLMWGLSPQQMEPHSRL